jgi:transcriptional regulator with XRE-family HTH domain
MSRKNQAAAEQLRRAIREAERRGVTRYQMAKMAKMPQSQLSRIATGESVPKLDTAERIAGAIGYTLIVAKKVV